MAVAVFLYVPALGHIRPALALANELVKRGDIVHFFSTSDYRAEIAGENIIYENYWFWEKRFSRINNSKIIDKRFLTYEEYEFFAEVKIVASHNIADMLEKIISELKVDYIVHDQTMLCGARLAEKLRTPSFCHYVTMIYNAQMLKKRPEFYLSTVYKFNPEQYPDHELSIKTIGDIADRCYLKNGKREEDYAFVLNGMNVRASHNLSYLVEELQIDSSCLDGSYALCGAPQLPAYESIKRRSIFVSMGTGTLGTFDKDRKIAYFKLCIDAFADTDFEVDIYLGDIDSNYFTNNAKNIRLANSVDQTRMLSRASLAIIHGGLSGTVEAFYYNTPAIVLPFIYDQFMVATVLEEGRLGYTANVSEMDEGKLIYLVKKALADETCRENVELVSRHLRARNGAKVMADKIYGG